MKRVALLIILISLTTAVPVACQGDEKEETATVSSEVKEGLKLELTVPKVEYQTGEVLEAALSLVNVTDAAISFSTRTSQLFDMTMKAAGLEGEMRWSEDMMFLQVITPYNIPANGAMSQELTWEVNLGPGDVFLSGLTVSFTLDGKQVSLSTPAINITVK